MRRRGWWDAICAHGHALEYPKGHALIAERLASALRVLGWILEPSGQSRPPVKPGNAGPNRQIRLSVAVQIVIEIRLKRIEVLRDDIGVAPVGPSGAGIEAAQVIPESRPADDAVRKAAQVEQVQRCGQRQGLASQA